jgi:indolepyruvate ferredoxin oxidoreductase beta subunit
MREPFNILVAGVGGQGNLVCGRVLAEAAIRQGLQPVVGDTFGASRRGGSVLTHLRLGTHDWAPLIPRGEVDILLGLEPLEALRAAIEYAGERTIALVSTTEVSTAGVESGESEYPQLEKITMSLTERCKKVYMLDAESALLRAGSPRALNAFLLGSMSVLLESPLSQELIREALYDFLGQDTVNATAFEEGVAAIE